MFTVNSVKLNNSYAVGFKGHFPNNSPLTVLPDDPEARRTYLERNKEVFSEGFADGDLPFSQLIARRLVSLWKLLTQDEKVAKQAQVIERQIRDIVKEGHGIGQKLDKAA